MNSSPSTASIMWMASSAAVVLGSLGVFLAYPQPDLKLEEDILPMARAFAKKRKEDSTKTPLTGVRVVITGATGGIGLGLVENFATLGATVIAMGRSPTKLKELQETFAGKDIVPILVQLTDLASVQKAAENIASQFDRVDILVNNAGIHYFASANGSAPTTPQGLDVSWGVNYMSHFLLTEKLMDLLQKSSYTPTVIQISSTYHCAVDGSDIVIPKDKNKDPLVAVPGVFTGKSLFGMQRAYANSKLAQILHARALQRRHPELVVKSICPCWVGTGIAGKSMMGLILSRLAFPNNGFGVKSALTAALDTTSPKSADWITNSQCTTWVDKFFPNMMYKSWFYKYRLRDALAFGFANWIMLTTQRFFIKVEARKASPETYNKELQESLYEWSYQKVEPFL